MQAFHAGLLAAASRWALFAGSHHASQMLPERIWASCETTPSKICAHPDEEACTWRFCMLVRTCPNLDETSSGTFCLACIRFIVRFGTGTHIEGIRPVCMLTTVAEHCLCCYTDTNRPAPSTYAEPDHCGRRARGKSLWNKSISQ